MGYVSTGMGDRFSALLLSPMALQLTLVDRNPFQPCINRELQLQIYNWIAIMEHVHGYDLNVRIRSMFVHVLHIL